MEAVQAAYRRLLGDPQGLEAFSAPMAVHEWLSLFKRYGQLQHCDADRLLAQLMACAQTSKITTSLPGPWMPAYYGSTEGSVSVCWPDGKATEPFYDQFVARSQGCRPLNLFSPTVAIDDLIPESYSPPAGFIAHLSRCGSTWVSTSLALLDQSAVVSESPVLTDFLLDTQWSERQRREWLPGLVAAHAPGGKAGYRAVIKWNAWDLCQWSTIKAANPDVPVLLIVRHPLEVLASHARQAGRHMAGDKTLAHIDPVFAHSYTSVWELRLKVLGCLLERMRAISHCTNVKVIDYSALGPDTMVGIARHFGLAVSREVVGRIARLSNYSAKAPEQRFSSDIASKRQLWSPAEKAQVERYLMPAYRQLLALSQV